MNQHYRLLIACMLTSGSVHAQQAVIDTCRQTSSDKDRIACLEAAILMQEHSSTDQVDPPSLEIDTGESDSTPEQDSEPEETGKPDGIGAQQVIARAQTQEEIEASLEKERNLKVKGYKQIAYGRIEITLENGQIWRQIRGDAQEIRVDLRRNQTVDITESGLGGYKLRLNEMRRTIRVQRIR